MYQKNQVIHNKKTWNNLLRGPQIKYLQGQKTSKTILLGLEPEKVENRCCSALYLFYKALWLCINNRERSCITRVSKLTSRMNKLLYFAKNQSHLLIQKNLLTVNNGVFHFTLQNTDILAMIIMVSVKTK